MHSMLLRTQLFALPVLAPTSITRTLVTITLLAYNTGKYQLSVAEGLVLRQTGLPSWRGSLPQVVSQFTPKARLPRFGLSLYGAHPPQK